MNLLYFLDILADRFSQPSSEDFMKWIFCFLIIFASCAKQDSKPRTMEVSLGAVTAASLASGVIFRMINLATGVSSTVALSQAPFIVMIPDGSWDIQMVGFEGAGQWGGEVNCWSASKLVLTSTVKDIYLGENNILPCSKDPFSDLISMKNSRWDIARWDTAAKWAP